MSLTPEKVKEIRDWARSGKHAPNIVALCDEWEAQRKRLDDYETARQAIKPPRGASVDPESAGT